MKVICWDAEGTKGWLIEGHEYTVYNEDNHSFNIPVYFLIETSKDGQARPWDKNRFIQKSNIDETTFERNYNKQLV